jgi:Spy/CpxP family protein refolding chaperone
MGGPRPPSLNRWSKELGLTPDQQDKIKNIFKKNEERIKELESDYDKHKGEVRAQLKSPVSIEPERSRSSSLGIPQVSGFLA